MRPVSSLSCQGILVLFQVGVKFKLPSRRCWGLRLTLYIHSPLIRLLIHPAVHTYKTKKDMGRDQQIVFASLRREYQKTGQKYRCVIKNTFYRCAGLSLWPSEFSEHRVSVELLETSLVMTPVLQRGNLNFAWYRTFCDKPELNSFGCQVPHNRGGAWGWLKQMTYEVCPTPNNQCCYGAHKHWADVCGLDTNLKLKGTIKKSTYWWLVWWRGFF